LIQSANRRKIICPQRLNITIKPPQGGFSYLIKTEAGLPNLLSSRQLLDRIIEALTRKTPLSVVSVGATEAFVMAQYELFSETEIIGHPEALIANRGERQGFNHRGIRFPNIAARDQAVEAVRKADIIGYNTLIESAKTLTERVLHAYSITPSDLFESNLRRVIMFSQPDRFKAMLRGRRLLLIGSPAPMVRQALQNPYRQDLSCEIVGAIPIYEFEDIPRVLDSISSYEFDLCLLAAGVNALILAPYIAQSFSKVAFDIGWGMESLVTGRVVLDQWLAYLIGIENIMGM